MKDEYAKARVKDIKKAHEDGCDDVKRVLENMYPDICEKETKYCCEWMRGAVKLGGIADSLTPSYRHAFVEINPNGDNILHYCPRCGQKFPG